MRYMAHRDGGAASYREFKMTKIEDEEVVHAVRQLYNDDDQAKALFDWLSNRERHTSETMIETVCRHVNVTRSEAITLMKALSTTNWVERPLVHLLL
jgi:hypothetical protein